MENRPHPGIRSKTIGLPGRTKILLKKVQPALPPPRKNRKKPLHNGFPIFPKQEDMPSM